jgi:hypothetical protein
LAKGGKIIAMWDAVTQEAIFIRALIQALPEGVVLSVHHNIKDLHRDYVLAHVERHLEISFASDPTDVCNTAIRGKEALDQMKKWLANSP